MDYNYLENEIEDVKNYIKENYSKDELTRLIIKKEENEDGEGLEDFKNKLYDILFIEDSVTGNASGSYTFNTYKAEEYIAHNLDLLQEALEEFGEIDVNIRDKGAEWCDVTIRCYLLPQAIENAIKELEEELPRKFKINEISEIKNLSIKINKKEKTIKSYYKNMQIEFSLLAHIAEGKEYFTELLNDSLKCGYNLAK